MLELEPRAVDTHFSASFISLGKRGLVNPDVPTLVQGFLGHCSPTIPPVSERQSRAFIHAQSITRDLAL